jgi:hypothetical protein
MDQIETSILDKVLTTYPSPLSLSLPFFFSLSLSRPSLSLFPFSSLSLFLAPLFSLSPFFFTLFLPPASLVKNWSNVLYLNIYGCDRFDAFNYTMIPHADIMNDYTYHRYGAMILPICSQPKARPILSGLVFITFITLCGFILMNITIAAVAAGISDRLDALRKEDFAHELGLKPSSNASQVVEETGRAVFTDPDFLLMLLKQVWSEESSARRRRGKPSESEREQDNETASQATTKEDEGFTARFKWSRQSLAMRDLTGTALYTYLTAALVTSSALIELYLLQKKASSQADQTITAPDVLQILLQIIFTLDLYCQVVAAYPNLTAFFHNKWNQFDSVLVLLTWVPIITISTPHASNTGTHLPRPYI